MNILILALTDAVRTCLYCFSLCTWSNNIIRDWDTKIGLVWGNVFLTFLPCKCLRSRGKFLKRAKLIGGNRGTHLVGFASLLHAGCLGGKAFKREFYVSNIWVCITETQSHRIIEVGRDQWRSPATPLPKQGHVGLVAQGHVQMSQVSRRYPSLLCAACHSKKKKKNTQMFSSNLLCFSLCP